MGMPRFSGYGLETTKTSKGYMRLRYTDRRRQIIYEHRIVVERNLGHPLPDGASIHHSNGIKDDNRLENLVFCESEAHHRKLHKMEKSSMTKKMKGANEGFPARVRKIRADSGLSGEDFADIIGISQGFLSFLETGGRKPNKPTIIAICAKFDVNETWLRTGKGKIYSKAVA